MQKFFKHILPHTLLGRSLMIIITPVLLLQIITSVIFFDRHWSAMSARLMDAVTRDIAFIVKTVEGESDPALIHYLLIEFSKSFGVIASYEEELTWAPINSFVPPWPTVEQELSKTLKTRIDNKFLVNPYEKDKLYEVFIKISDSHDLRIIVPERRLFSATSYIFILWLLGSSFVLFAIAAIFMRNQIRPIRKLAIVAEQFGKGREVTDFKPAGAREVRQAATSFVQMKERIRRQMEQRTAMLAGVSHDLRTPITRMKLQLELLGDSPDIADLRQDLQEMERMIDGYLSFARDESDEQLGSTNINDLLNKVAHTAKRQNIPLTITYDKDQDHMCDIRPNAFERCLMNLINNGHKYGGDVWLSLTSNDTHYTITIEDNGQGIPEAQYEDVFKPFFRLEASRNSETGGIGLGLSIAQDIMHSHGGKISLGQSLEHGGLAVTLTLPH